MKVNVKIEKIVTTQFTEEEMNALKTLSQVECCGVMCGQCPLNGHVTGTINICISVLANRILMKEGIKCES